MKGEIPKRIPFIEKLQGFCYGLLVALAWIIMVGAIVFILIYFVSFILHKDFFNKDFIQLCIYLVIGTFLVIFVYDQHCRRKILPQKKIINSKNEDNLK